MRNVIKPSFNYTCLVLRIYSEYNKVLNECHKPRGYVDLYSTQYVVSSDMKLFLASTAKYEALNLQLQGANRRLPNVVSALPQSKIRQEATMQGKHARQLSTLFLVNQSVRLNVLQFRLLFCLRI